VLVKSIVDYIEIHDMQLMQSPIVNNVEGSPKVLAYSMFYPESTYISCICLKHMWNVLETQDYVRSTRRMCFKHDIFLRKTDGMFFKCDTCT
jgi:hypothetical protein